VGRPARSPVGPLCDRLRSRAASAAASAARRLDPPGRILSAEDVHEIRRETKRLRALWQLLRPALGRSRARPPERSVRAVAKALETDREFDALAETLDRLAPEARAAERGEGRVSEVEAVERLRTLLAHDRAALAPPRADAGLLRRLEAQAVAIEDLPRPLAARDLAAGLRRSYRKARRAGRRARGSDDPAQAAPHWHRARRWAKYEHLQIGLLGRPGGSRERRRRLKRFAKVAGQHHDLQDLRDAMAARADALEAGDAVGALRGLVARAEADLAGELARRHRRLYRKAPKRRARAVRRRLAD
jgi:CHAD domain-containing protein